MNQRIRAGSTYAHERHRARPVWSLLALLLALALGAGGWWLWQKHGPDSTEPGAAQPLRHDDGAVAQGSAGGDTPAQDGAAPPPEEAPAEPHNLLEPPTEAIALPPLQEADPVVSSAIAGWLGKDNAYAFVQSKDFVRRFVATVDNLPRAQAPARVWPVNPTAPRFQVENSAPGQSTAIAAGNATRYQPAVQFARSLDMAQAATHYKQYYPLFQEAYEELGYPGKYFNDRLITVIDHLLQAPEPAVAEVRSVEVKGEYAAQQPWARYEFVDPQLETLSSGQKILVRMGPANARALKAQLRAFRQHISAAP